MMLNNAANTKSDFPSGILILLLKVKVKVKVKVAVDRAVLFG